MICQKNHEDWLVGVWDRKNVVLSFSDSILMGSHQELGPILKRKSNCWKSLETRGSKLLFTKISLGDCLRSYRQLVETQTILMVSNMIVYFIYFSGCVSRVVKGIVHEYNWDLMVAHVDVLETTL